MDKSYLLHNLKVYDNAEEGVDTLDLKFENIHYDDNWNIISNVYEINHFFGDENPGEFITLHENVSLTGGGGGGGDSAVLLNVASYTIAADDTSTSSETLGTINVSIPEGVDMENRMILAICQRDSFAVSTYAGSIGIAKVYPNTTISLAGQHLRYMDTSSIISTTTYAGRGIWIDSATILNNGNFQCAVKKQYNSSNTPNWGGLYHCYIYAIDYPPALQPFPNRL